MMRKLLNISQERPNIYNKIQNYKQPQQRKGDLVRLLRTWALHDVIGQFLLQMRS
jgi:hypothetical protein